ncbi:MAG: DUF362 domain-containing protein [Spirochaetaceae bacterium]|nr:DUF362 domain-containing protein [Spirochaetaceae bacterium]
MKKTVAIQKCNSYNVESVYNAVKKLIELSPPPNVSGKTVLIKPNILSPKKPEAAVCTHPVVVGAVVKCFIELGATKVIVGESPATAASTFAAKTTGMYEQVIQNGGIWADFSKEVNISAPQAKLAHNFAFAEPFAQADIIVSVAKLKSHQLMAYTGAMKNLFGLVVGLKKAQMHYRFPNKKDFATYLTDLNIAAKAQYAIMDAIVGMDGPGGPGNGNPISMNFLAASTNILALDWICARAAGYNPTEVPNLNDAMERKIWLNSEDEIQLVGCNFEEIKCSTFKAVHLKATAHSLGKMLPPFVDSLARLIFERNPHFDKKRCIKCGKCIEICPPKILSFAVNKNGSKSHIQIQRSQCLRCYCCHEICPVEAITLGRF